MFGQVAVGWLLATLLLVLFPLRTSVLVCMVTLTATAAIASQHTFPHCIKAVRNSWLGPGILAVLLPLVEHWQSTLVEHQGLQTIIAVFLAKEFINVAFALWLFRGYGLVLLAALTVAMVPRSEHIVRAAATAYPGRLWWLVPSVLLTKGCLFSVALGVLLSRSPR